MTTADGATWRAEPSERPAFAGKRKNRPRRALYWVRPLRRSPPTGHPPMFRTVFRHHNWKPIRRPMTPTPAEPVARLEFPGGKSFSVVHADLLREPVDAIVNAANGHLAHGGGVAAAIARAAGAELVKDGDALVARDGPIPTGGA